MRKFIYLAVFSIFMLNFMASSVNAQPAWKEDMKYEKEKMKKQQEYEREKAKAEREYEREKAKAEAEYEREKAKAEREYEREFNKDKGNSGGSYEYDGNENGESYDYESNENTSNSSSDEQRYKDWYKRWKQLPPDRQKEEIRKLSPQQRQKLKAYLQKKGINIDSLENGGNNGSVTPNTNMTPLEKWRQMPKAKRQQLYSQLPNDMKSQLDSWMSMTLADRKQAWQNLPEGEKKKWRKAFARF